MKKSFILYIDSLAVLDALDDESSGKLFKAIKLYHETGECALTGPLKAVFITFTKQFERDAEKYQSRLNANRINGLKGGRPKPKITQNNPLGFLETQHNPKEPDSDSDSDKERKKENKQKKETDIAKPDSVSESVWRDFLILRKNKKAPITATVIAMIESEADKAGITLDAALAECCTRGWQSFKSDWHSNKNQFSKPAAVKSNVRTIK